MIFEAKDAATLQKAGITTLLDLALLLPKSFDDLSVRDAPCAGDSTAEVECLFQHRRGSMLIVTAHCLSWEREIKIVIFNAKSWHFGAFKRGKKFFIHGKCDESFGSWQFVNPKIVSEPGRIAPKYKAALSDAAAQKLIKKYLSASALLGCGLRADEAAVLLALHESSPRSVRMLAALNRQLKEGGAALSLRRLAALADHAHTRHNLIFLLLANAFFLSDLHFAHRIARWQEKAAAHLGDWLAVWAETEVLLSLSTVGLVREMYAFPELLEDASPRLEAKNLTHLLIPEEKAVPNDIDATAGTRIITGSNMSGKTTYLRTVASACVLAYAGAPVPGERFCLSPLHIFTSIRVTDDAAHGLSTFYAEILRIKSMMAFKEKSLPMLIVIDEIFKGTNSADRLVGAKEAIQRLTGPLFLTLVSTHDFELCNIKSDSAPITNWHFEESYEDGKILFDYKIKEGRCTTRNAQYLLKMAGIME